MITIKVYTNMFIFLYSCRIEVVEGCYFLAEIYWINTIIVPSLTDIVRIVTIQGKLKESRKQVSELQFDFPIEAIGM